MKNKRRICFLELAKTVHGWQKINNDNGLSLSGDAIFNRIFFFCATRKLKTYALIFYPD
jgi:hypothetical protein